MHGRLWHLGLISCTMKFADRLWIVAYYIEVFGKIETFDKGINHKRTDRKSEEGIEFGRNVKHKAAGNGDHHIGDQKCMLISTLEYFFRIMAMISVPPLEEPMLNKIAEPREGRAMAKTKLQHGLIGQRGLLDKSVPMQTGKQIKECCSRQFLRQIFCQR